MKITRNSIVTLHHRLGFTDGSVLEDTFDDAPLTFHLGSGELAEGLELSLVDLQQGDEQTIDIPPDLAFGFSDPTLIHLLPLDEFDPAKPLEPGLVIEFSTPNGETLPGTILEIDQGIVKVDFNHPLADQTVRYQVKIVDVTQPDDVPETLN